MNIRPPKLKSLMLLVKHWYRQVSTFTHLYQEAATVTIFTSK